MVDISMADGALSWLALVAGRYFCDEEVPRRGEQQLAGGLLCYYPYETADGVGSPAARWSRSSGPLSARAPAVPHLIEVQFEAPGSDAWHEVAEVFRGRTREEWKEFNDEHDCCIEPVLDLDEALDSELVRERGMVTEVDQPGIGIVEQLGLPVKMSRTPGDPTRPAPAFGEHTDEVLREAGYSRRGDRRDEGVRRRRRPSADSATTFRA